MTDREHEGGPELTVEDIRVPEWVHPTGRSPQSIAVVACGPTNADWHAGNFTLERQFPSVDEVWALNMGLRTIRCDLGWCMDDIVQTERDVPGFGRELGKLRIPIITTNADADAQAIVPGVLAYPLKLVLGHVGKRVLMAQGLTEATETDIMQAGKEVGYYLHNSLPYILAYALMIRVKYVQLFGVDYHFPGQTAREDDRANCEYWVGALRFSGVRVVVPNTTTLLSTRRGPFLYGYSPRAPVMP